MIEKPDKSLLIKLGLIGASFVCAALAHYFAGDDYKMIHPTASILAWFTGVGLSVFATCRSEKKKNAKPFTPSLPRWECLALLSLFIFALLVRLIAIGKIPPVLSGDEAGFGLVSADIAKGHFNNPFATGWYHFPSLYFMLPALAIVIWGQTIEAVRISSAIAGAITVVGVYCLGRVMFGRAIGWVSAILLAGLSFHIQFSRLGLNNIWDGAFIVFILTLFWCAWYKGNRLYFVGAGALIGLSQYFYTSAHIVPVIILLWLTCMFLAERKLLKQRLSDLVCMGLVAGVVFFPLALYYFNRPIEFWEPMAWVSALPQIVADFQFDKFMGFFTLLYNFIRVVLGFISVPLISFYTLQRPLLPILLVPFFILGTGIALFHQRDARYRVLLLWWILVIVINLLSVFPPVAHRYVIGAPLAVLLVSIGMMTIIHWGVYRWPSARRYVNVAAILLVAITVGMELHFYFIERSSIYGFYKNDGVRIDVNSEVAMDLSLYLEKYHTSTHVIFFGAPQMWYAGYPEMKYLVPQVQFNDIEIGAALPKLTLSSGLHILFVFLPHRLADVPQVVQLYPGGISRWIYSKRDASPLFYIYEITIP